MRDAGTLKTKFALKIYFENINVNFLKTFVARITDNHLLGWPLAGVVLFQFHEDQSLK